MLTKYNGSQIVSLYMLFDLWNKYNFIEGFHDQSPQGSFDTTSRLCPRPEPSQHPSQMSHQPGTHHSPPWTSGNRHRLDGVPAGWRRQPLL